MARQWNFSGQLYNFVSYGVNSDTGMIDYNDAEAIALRRETKNDHGPAPAPIHGISIIRRSG